MANYELGSVRISHNNHVVFLEVEGKRVLAFDHQNPSGAANELYSAMIRMITNPPQIKAEEID